MRNLEQMASALNTEEKGEQVTVSMVMDKVLEIYNRLDQMRPVEVEAEVEEEEVEEVPEETPEETPEEEPDDEKGDEE